MCDRTGERSQKITIKKKKIRLAESKKTLQGVFFIYFDLDFD